MDIPFIDEGGITVTLRVFVTAPTILALACHNCPNACDYLLIGRHQPMRVERKGSA